MDDDTIVWWNTRRLADEFGLRPFQVGRLLKALGAKKWSNRRTNGGAIWYWEDEDDGQ